MNVCDVCQQPAHPAWVGWFGDVMLVGCSSKHLDAARMRHWEAIRDQMARERRAAAEQESARVRRASAKRAPRSSSSRFRNRQGVDLRGVFGERDEQG